MSLIQDVREKSPIEHFGLVGHISLTPSRLWIKGYVYIKTTVEEQRHAKRCEELIESWRAGE